MDSEGRRKERKTEGERGATGAFPRLPFFDLWHPYSAGLLFFSNLKTYLIHDEDGSADR
jgi:hypothetical protein